MFYNRYAFFVVHSLGWLNMKWTDMQDLLHYAYIS
jgi:hypothetical protein